MKKLSKQNFDEIIKNRFQNYEVVPPENIFHNLKQTFKDNDVKIYNAHSKGLKSFPSAAELATSKLIILSDVSGGEFSQTQMNQIKK